MQLSYNVIKKDRINSNTVYTVQAPPVQLKQEVCEMTDIYPESPEDINKKAAAIISDAEARRNDIIDAAMKEAERIKKDAYEMAYKRGYSEGLKKGQEDVLNSTKEIRDEARSVLNEAHRVSREHIEGQRDEIINLALDIAEKIIGYQADMDDSVIANIVGNAIHSAVVKEQIIVRVNPMDYALLDCRIDDILKNEGYENAIVSIIRDSDIKRGGCRLDTGISSVDAQIDTQLEKVKEALVG